MQSAGSWTEIELERAVGSFGAAPSMGRQGDTNKIEQLFHRRLGLREVEILWTRRTSQLSLARQYGNQRIDHTSLLISPRYSIFHRMKIETRGRITFKVGASSARSRSLLLKRRYTVPAMKQPTASSGATEHCIQVKILAGTRPYQCGLVAFSSGVDSRHKGRLGPFARSSAHCRRSRIVAGQR